MLYVTYIDWSISVHLLFPPLDKESFYPLIDVNWWVDSAVILARCSGALTVSSVKTLKNLLGKSCEWFEPSPQVTATHDGGFLSLEVILSFLKQQVCLRIVGKILWRRAWQPTPVFLPGESHGQRSLAGYSLWDCKESDTTEWLTLLTTTVYYKRNLNVWFLILSIPLFNLIF